MDTENILYEMDPYTFFKGALDLFDIDLEELGLSLGSIGLADQTTILITGPKPPRFEEVCMQTWKRICEDEWRKPINGKVIFKWNSGRECGDPIPVPGIATVLELLVSECKPVEKVPPLYFMWKEGGALKVDPKAPYEIARQLLELDWTVVGVEDAEPYPTLYCIAGDYFAWVGTHYVQRAEAQMRNHIYARLSEAKCVDGNDAFNPDKTKVTKIDDALRSLTHHTSDSGANFWIDDEFGDRNLISIKNGLLDPVARSVQPHSPLFFTRNSLPVWYEPGRRRRPREWLKFLNSVWPSDQESVRLLQQWMGYLIANRIDMHKILLLVGPPRSGKGTIAGVITKLLGAANVAGPTLTDLVGNFGLAPLIGKTLAIVGDARFAGRQDQMAQVTSRLLSISGGDTLTVDRKHREPWIGKLGARLLICTNELPRLNDASGALASRFTTLQMRRSFLGEEDLTLAARLEVELPAILAWSLDGLADLNYLQRFVEPQASAEAKRDFAAMASPVADFVSEICVIQDSISVRCDVLFSRWQRWCKEQGREHRRSQQLFGRDLKAAFPSVSTTQARGGEMRGKRVYTGIGLREQDAETAFQAAWNKRNASGT